MPKLTQLQKVRRNSRLRAIAPAMRDHYASLVSDEHHNTLETIDRLVECCKKSNAEILRFHRKSADAPHYHQMLSTFLLRHIDSLNVIRDLLKKTRYEHASAIVRMAYEAYLNFYIDWLCPEFFGPRLQAFSYYQTYLQRSKSAEDQQSKTNLLLSLGGFDVVFDKSVNKARLSPLGEIFHDISYPTLSSIVHQTYGHLERDTVDFGDETMKPDPEMVRVLYRWIDVITASIVITVRNEIGLASPTAPEAKK